MNFDVEPTTLPAGPPATVLDRLAGAPISWGVCEVDDWGYQVEPQVVFTQMRDAGLSATEFGPADYLPSNPTQRSDFLKDLGLQAVGGFLPVVLHDPTVDPCVVVGETLDHLVAAAADNLVLAAATGQSGYDGRPDLDEEGWTTLLTNLDRVRDLASSRGVRVTLHPHGGTLVEGPADVKRVVEGSRIDFCLDTGHLLIGGVDPVEFTRTTADRIAHVHLKDVDADIAQAVRSRNITYTEAVARRMYRPLGQGDAGIAEIVQLLEQAGYSGWYVLEQDRVLAGPEDTAGALSDVLASIEFLRSIAPHCSRPAGT